MPSQKLEALTGTLVLAILSSGIGSAFHHGFNLGVLNAPQKLLEDFINDTYTQRFEEPASKATVTLIFSIFVSVFCVGGMVGGLLTAMVAEKLGRKRGLLVNNLLVFVAAALMGFAKRAASYEMFVLGRFAVGINAGLSAGLGPMYLTEIAPVAYRGAVGTIYQLVLTVSILISQVLGIPLLLGNEEWWPLLFGVAAIPAILMFATLPCCPESPKYLLLVKGEHEAAETALKRLRGSSNVAFEMEVMTSEVESAKMMPKITLPAMLRNPALRSPLGISVMVMLAQQLSGINAAIFFSTDIFETAGIPEDLAIWGTLGMGAVNVAMTVVSMAIVERAGRRTLMLTGLAGMAVCTATLTATLALKHHGQWVSYMSVLGLVGFVVTFAVGPGSIPWFLVTELFGQSARSIATSIAVGINWTANFIVGLAFLPLMEVIEHYTFVVFTVVLLFFWLYIYKKLPETKNKTTEEITNMFRVRAYGDDLEMTKTVVNEKR